MIYQDSKNNQGKPSIDERKRMIQQILGNDKYQKIAIIDEKEASPARVSKKKRNKLEPIYGLGSLILLGLGNTIGSGFFTLTGIASKLAGTGVSVAYLISGTIALLTAFAYAEFAALIPKSGSSYLYAYTVFGELPAWIVGWNQNVRYGGACATQARGFSSFFMQLFAFLNLPLPTWFDSTNVLGMYGSPLAVVFLLFCNVITNQGAKCAGIFSNYVTVMILCILALVFLVSASMFNPENVFPFFNEEKGTTGVVEASCLLFFAFLGFDFLTTLSEEAINPKRNVPIAIQASIALTMTIYAVIAFALNGVGNLAKTGTGIGAGAISEVFESRNLSIVSLILIICTILGITASSIGNLMGQARILTSYSKDGLISGVFQELDPVKKVPVKGSWISLIPICMASFFMNLTQLAKLCTLCNLITYAFVDVAVLILRLREDEK